LTDLPAWAGVLLISAATFGPLAGWYASRRRRQPVIWWVFGSLIGPLALILLRVAPPGRCPACDTRVQGWPSSCEVCGWPFEIPLRGPSEATQPVAEPALQAERAHPLVVQMSTEITPIPVQVNGSLRPSSGDAGIRRWVTSGTARPPRDDGGQATRDGEMLATAVYFGGTAGLVVGSRYSIVRQEDRLRLMGPIDWDPTATALERPIAELMVTAIEDRLIIRSEGWRGVALAFGSLAGSTGEDLEIALTMPSMIVPGVRPA
jgi:hypothetical protein